MTSPPPIPAVDWYDTIEARSEDAVRNYTNAWAEQIGRTTYREIQESVIRARQKGTGVEAVLRDMERLFSPERARTIAVTETTRLFGVASQEAYRQFDIEEWEWQTVEDPWVSDVCTELNGETFPISRQFEPAHPNCRCFPKPVVKQPRPAGEPVGVGRPEPSLKPSQPHGQHPSPYRSIPDPSRRTEPAFRDPQIREEELATIDRINVELRKGTPRRSLAKRVRDFIKDMDERLEAQENPAPGLIVYANVKPDVAERRIADGIWAPGKPTTDLGYGVYSLSREVAYRADPFGWIVELRIPQGAKGAFSNSPQWTMVVPRGQVVIVEDIDYPASTVTMYEPAPVEAQKHLPGKHDQQRHGGGTGSGHASTVSVKETVEIARSLGDPLDWASTNNSKLFHAAILKRQGFDGKPKLVSEAEMDAVGRDSDYYRGVHADSSFQASQYIEQFKNGELFIGEGLNGLGTYAAPNKGMAIDYARGEPENVIRMAFDPASNPRGIGNDEARKLGADKIKELDDMKDITPEERTAMRFLLRDPGTAAAMDGYDYVYSTGRVMVIQNRSKLMVQD